MACSGIQVKQDCVEAFELLKQKKKYSYVTFKISDNKENVEVDKLGDKNETFEDFRNCMTSEFARYAVYDHDTKKDGKGGNLGFVYWVKEEAPVKEKMVYATTKDTLKKKLNLEMEWQVNSEADFIEESMPAKMKK